MKRRMDTVTIELPDEKPVSLNKFYSQAWTHWHRSAEKNRVLELVRAYIDPDEAHLFDCPVYISVDVHSTRPLDPDNVMAKFYIDALKDWYITDDTWRHIAGVSLSSTRDKQNPRTVITITPCGDCDE